jgi:hypothetical protein
MRDVVTSRRGLTSLLRVAPPPGERFFEELSTGDALTVERFVEPVAERFFAEALFEARDVPLARDPLAGFVVLLVMALDR